MVEKNMSEEKILTLQEIKDRYNSEWILVKDPDLDKHHEVIRGKVVCHSKDRDEVYRKAMQIRLHAGAILFTGKAPKGMVFAL
jgi:hypothetical protein